MRTKPQIETDISKLHQVRSKTADQAKQLQAEIDSELDRLGGDILAGGNGSTSQKLSDMRSRQEGLTRALEISNEKLDSLQRELEQVELSNKLIGLDAARQERAAHFHAVKDLIGAKGAKGELDAMLAAIESTQAVNQLLSQDEQIHMARLRELWREGSRSLFNIWAAIDRIENGKGNYLGPQRDEANDVVGFGRVP